MHYNGVPPMPTGPIATETAAAVVRELTSGEHALPVAPVTPIATFPGQAPPNSPVPTPQPVYPVSNPNSWMGMSPNIAKLVQFGFAGLAAAGIVWYARNESERGNASQKVIVDSFQTMQKESREDARDLNRTMMSTMQEISGNLAKTARSMERLEAKLDGKKD